MNSKSTLMRTTARNALAVLCSVAIGPGNAFAAGWAPRPGVQSSASQEAAPIPPDQLDSLVAPLALYPDPLLAQTLAASTYPLEIMQLQQWLTRNTGLKDKALADAAAQQPWDPSVQAMAMLPDVVKRLSDDIRWTTDLGNAFLAQQADVMQAVQRMRGKAQATGNLKTTEQQVVETRVVEHEQVIVIEQASPEVVYVPSYNPVAVYGPPLYPYPPIYYPPYYSTGAVAAGMAISWGVGVAMGAAWGGGGWGWNAGWGGNNININNNNNFVRNANVRAGTVNNYRGGTVNNSWQHNAAHRGGAPYGNRATANRYGGTARGDSLANRQAGARQQVARQGGNLPSNRAAGTSGMANRAGAADRAGGNWGAGANRTGAAGRSGGNWGAGGSGQPSSRDFSRGSGAAGGADRIGQRDLSRGSGSNHAFSSGSQRYDGNSARASSDRGSHSMQSRSGSGSRSGSFSGGHGGSRSGGGSRGGGGGRR